MVYLAHRDEGLPDTSIDYLFVDADPKSFLADDPSWTVLGRSIALPKRSQLEIQGANLNTIIDNLNSYPNLKPWLGDRSQWREVLAGLNVDAAGGQKRRLGRFLFAMNVDKFNERVSSRVRDIQDAGKSTDITFHVFAGLAGGTGSGSIVDVVAQLRKRFPSSDQRIFLYLYLPDQNPPQNWNTGNYHSNAYAALLELNAMSAGAWAPFDVENGSGPVQVPGDLWFNGAYVFSDDNNQGFRASIEKDLPDIVADFAYHKTIAARGSGWDDLQRFENSENGDSTPEALSGSPKGQRSVRFLSFGIRRLAFPEETIREQLVYEFANQAYRQLQFNNWQDGVGFLDQAKPQANAEFVAGSKQREDWKITDDHLSLSRPIIEINSNRSHSPYEQEWEEYHVHYVSIAKQSPEKPERLRLLNGHFQEAWNSGFRNVGAGQFFQSADRDVKDHATEIRNSVESSLFGEWRTGTRSIGECTRVVDALMIELRSHQSSIDDAINSYVDRSEEASRRKDEIERRWNQTGIFGQIVGKYDRLLEEAGQALRDEYTARTLAEGSRFAKRLLAETIETITDLRNSLGQAQASLAAASEAAMRVVSTRAHESNKGTSLKQDGYIVRIQDDKAFENARRKLLFNEEEQRGQVSEVRNKIIDQLGHDQSFTKFTSRFPQADMKSIIVETCEKNVESAHARLISEQREKVIGVSIIDKLMEQWGTNDDRITREANDLVRSAGQFVEFDSAEVNKHFDGKSAAVRGMRTFAVLMPQPPEHAPYVEQLKAGFRNACTDGVNFASTGERQSEITLVSLVNLFPLRFTKIGRLLRDRYRSRLETDISGRIRLEIHTQDDCAGLPDLFIAEAADIMRAARPLLLLGEIVGTIKAEANIASGRPQYIFLRSADGGIAPAPEVLGKTAVDALTDISESKLIEIKDEVLNLLSSCKTGDSDFQNSAAQTLNARLEDILVELGSDPTSKPYAEWNRAARHALSVLKGEVELDNLK
tara:strand:- start:14320 stop:17289 length:2970 start_codon:yes stop_codon:yes gene_type:complete